MPQLAFDNVSGVSAGNIRRMDEENRSSLQLIHYWDELRGERPFPVEDDIDPDHPALRDVWGQCFVVQVRDFEKLDFNYTYLGPSIIDAYRELVDNEQSLMVSMTATKLMPVYQQLIRERRPLVHVGEFTDERGNIIKFRQCLLPFGRDKVEVIFGHMTYQIYT